MRAVFFSCRVTVSLPSAVAGRHASRLQQQQTVSGSLPRVWFGEQAVRYGIVHDTYSICIAPTEINKQWNIPLPSEFEQIILPPYVISYNRI